MFKNETKRQKRLALKILNVYISIDKMLILIQSFMKKMIAQHPTFFLSELSC